MKKKIAYR